MDFIRQHTTARARRGSIVVGFLFAFAVVVGGEVYRSNSVAGLAESPGRVLTGIALAAIACVAAAAVALLLTGAQKKLRAVKAAPAVLGTRKAALVIGAVIFLCWLPCLLAYWPGLLTYDLPTQTDFIASGRWTTQQPPLHTLVWALFLQLEGFCGLHAITWYSLAQMAFLAASFAAVLSFLAKRGVSLALWVIAFAFFALNPVVALFAITPVKDALLAGALSLVLVGLAQVVADPSVFMQSKGRLIGLVAGIIACCLLRSNMLVAFVAFGIIATVVLKESRKTVALVIGIPIALAAVVIGPGYALAGITPGSSAVASVPFQQVANVVRNHGPELSEEEIATIDAVLPVDLISERYNPRFADSVVRLFKGKESGAAALRDELSKLTFLWPQLIARYPLDCVDAFLSLNVPYWYPFSDTPDPYSQRAYIETSVWKTTDNYSADPDSKLPALRDAYEQVADFSALDNPVCRIVFSPSSALWVIVLAFFLLYNSGSRRNALLAALPLLFWLSFLIGPVSNMRYMFPLFCLYPLLACAALQPGLVFSEAVKRS